MKFRVGNQLGLKFKGQNYTSDKLWVEVESDDVKEVNSGDLSHMLGVLYQRLLKEHLIRENIDSSEYKLYVEQYKKRREAINEPKIS